MSHTATPPDTSNAIQSTAAETWILLGRGGLGSAAKQELQAVQQQVQALHPEVQVLIAFVDRALPSLPEALDACDHSQQIRIVPSFMPSENALLRWLEKVVQRWRHRQADSSRLPRITFATPLGQSAELAPLLAQAAEQATALPDVTQTTPDDGDWHNDPKAWSTIPPHQRHVLFCMGPRCTALGAATLWPHLSSTLQKTGKLRTSVMALQTSCQYPCNHGPLMVVYPDGHWYGQLDEAAIERIVCEHLDQGTVDAATWVHSTGTPQGQ